MHTDLNHLVKLFKGVRDVRDAMELYSLAPNMLKPDLWHIQTGFEHVYGVDIEQIYVQGVTGPLVRGMFLRYDKLIKILVDSNQPENWKHYVAVKELCHLILHDPLYMTSNPSTLIEMMIFEESKPASGEAPLDLVADMWTKYAAHELLFPFEVRAEARRLLDTGETSVFKLAQEHGVPEYVIEWTLRPGYMDICAVAWAQVEK